MKNLFKKTIIENIINSIQPQINFISFIFFYFHYKLMPVRITEVLQNSKFSPKLFITRKYFQ